jgi:hypothetical protein
MDIINPDKETVKELASLRQWAKRNKMHKALTILEDAMRSSNHFTQSLLIDDIRKASNIDGLCDLSSRVIFMDNDTRSFYEERLGELRINLKIAQHNYMKTKGLKTLLNKSSVYDPWIKTLLKISEKNLLRYRKNEGKRFSFFFIGSPTGDQVQFYPNPKGDDLLIGLIIQSYYGEYVMENAYCGEYLYCTSDDEGNLILQSPYNLPIRSDSTRPGQVDTIKEHGRTLLKNVFSEETVEKFEFQIDGVSR